MINFKSKEQAQGAKEALIVLLQDRELMECDLSAEIIQGPDTEDGAKTYEPTGVITITAVTFKKQEDK